MANAKEFYRFELILKDGQAILEAKLEPCNDIVTCFSAKSAEDMFLAILNRTLGANNTENDLVRKAIGENLMDDITALVDTLYINVDKSDTYTEPKVRYMLHQQLKGHLNAFSINTIVRKDHTLFGRLQSSPQLNAAYFQGLKNAECNADGKEIDPFDILLKAVKESNESFLNCDFYGFPTAEDLMYFLVDSTTKKNREIAQCVCCKKYFFKCRVHHEYCQRSCRQTMQNESYYCNDEEIKKLYNQTYQMIVRRCNGDVFAYRALPNDPLSIPTDILLDQVEMNRVKSHFLTLNYEKRQAFVDGYIQRTADQITEEDFQVVRSMYSQFLKNVHKQIKLLEKQ